MKIPTLKEINKLSKDEEHYFTLFNIIDHIYCSLSYNEDLNKAFFLDIMCCGFSGELNHEKYFKLDEYDKMVETAKLWRKEIINNVMEEI